MVAYISPPTINTVELEDQLRDHIPSFLVPYLFQLLPRLPLTNYGEVSFLYAHSSDLFLELHASLIPVRRVLPLCLSKLLLLLLLT